MEAPFWGLEAMVVDQVDGLGTREYVGQSDRQE